MFKNASHTERRLGITGQIPAITEFTNVIMKYHEKNTMTGVQEQEKRYHIHHYVIG
jgi:hypothetical protein